MFINFQNNCNFQWDFNHRKKNCIGCHFKPFTVIWRTSFSLLHHLYHTCKTPWPLGTHHPPSPLCVPAFPLICIFPSETFMQDQSWEDMELMTGRTKEVFVRDLLDEAGEVGGVWGGYTGDKGTTMEGEDEIMLDWLTQLQKSCQSLLSLFFSDS